MRERITILTLLIICAISAFGRDYSVAGVVVDSIGEPESFATVRMYAMSDTAKVAAVVAAGENGRFTIIVNEAGAYKLTVTAVGKATYSTTVDLSDSQPSADLGTITLHDGSTMLGEVTVTAQRPLVIKEIDRLGYDVQADSESSTSTVAEILKKVPLVTVQPDGTILVNGSSSYRIYRNGRPNASYSNNAKELFKGLPASSIKRIEVITDPGAREDAEGVGAILNIVTLENVAMKGVSGNVGVSANSIDWYPNNGWLNLTTQIGKFTMSPYAGVWTGNKSTQQNQSSEYRYDDSGNIISRSASGKTPCYSTWFGLDSSLEVDSLNLLNFELSGSAFNFLGHNAGMDVTTRMTDLNGGLIYQYSEAMRYDFYKNIGLNMGLSYQHSTRRKDETITLSYRYSMSKGNTTTSSSYYDMINFPAPYDAIFNHNRTLMSENTLQLDWSRPYGSHHKLDLGVKYVDRRSHSNTTMDYVGDQSQNTRFRHLTSVGAAYADWRATYDRLGLRAGVRYEYTHMGSKYLTDSIPDFSSDLNDIVPNAAVNYNINDANMVKLGYSMRIGRPGINYLNPAVVESPVMVSFGNPHLSSSKSHAINFNYTLTKQKFSLNYSGSYHFSNNGIINIQSIDGDRLVSTYANAGHTRTVNNTLYLQWTISDKTSWMLNGSLSYSDYRNPDATPGVTLCSSGWGGSMYTRISQQLPWKIKGFASLSYWGGSVDGVYSRWRPLGSFAWDHDLSLERSFLKEDRLTLRVSASNPFGPSQGEFKSETLNSGRDGYTLSKQIHNRNIQMSISYRFGSLNAWVKKAKGIENDDVQGASSAPSTGGK